MRDIVRREREAGGAIGLRRRLADALLKEEQRVEQAGRRIRLGDDAAGAGEIRRDALWIGGEEDDGGGLLLLDVGSDIEAGGAVDEMDVDEGEIGVQRVD